MSELIEILEKSDEPITVQDRSVYFPELKTINGASILGSGDIEIVGGAGTTTTPTVESIIRPARSNVNFVFEGNSRTAGCLSSQRYTPIKFGIENK